MKIETGDIDIDIINRDNILDKIEHYPAIKIEDGKKIKHTTGVYVQDIEIDPETGYANFDYKTRENLNKIDFLNFSPLNNFISNKQIEKLSNIEPDWSLLKNKSFVENTTQIHNWFDFIKSLNIDSVDKLAMALAMIRPGKDYLKNKSWDEIEKEIWKQNNGKYNFKKSHAYSYALTIVALMNLKSGK